jgi:rhamnosyltransferase subunit B
VRILFATFGSLGDLHPVIALGLELRRRGHDAAIVTSAYHRERIASAGLDFFPAVPDLRPDDKALIRATMDERRGPEAVFRFMVADLPGTYADCRRAIDAYQPDVVVTSELAYAGIIAAETSRVRWASIILSPLSFLSPYDETVLPPARWLSRLHALGPRVYGVVLDLVKYSAARLARPINEFRRAQGLPAVRHPLFDGKHSPELVLAMFSPLIGDLRPDWPPQTVVTGYAFYDGDEPALDEEVEAFLQDGPAPIVFTLGSAAVFDPGPFFDESVKAALELRRRAILLVGPQPERLPLTNETVGVFAYAPFSKLFPRACAVVHQGGSGTTGQAMRAGRPMLIVPYAHDQPDNALRATKLGIAATVRRERYNARTAARGLEPLLRRSRVAARAAEIGAVVSDEDGAGVAADALEDTFGAVPVTPLEAR